MSADEAKKVPEHIQMPIKAYADEQMVRNAVGEEYDAMAEPPEVDVPREHRLCAPIIKALRDVYDPEIPVNVLDLGLIYDVSMEEEKVNIRMTLTAPGCGMGPMIAENVRSQLLTLPGIKEAKVEMVFDPPWTPELMSEDAKRQLGWE